MSVVVKHIPYQNRLAKLVQKPGGKRIADALAAADAGVQSLSEEGLAELDRLIAAVAAAVRGELAPGPLGKVYDQANEIVGIAGLFGFSEVGKAAFSLCDLLDRTEGGARCDRRALQVHADTLLLLRLRDGAADEQTAEILEGLRRVADRAAAAATPAAPRA